MNIGIDASRAFIKERTGTEEYSYQLIKHLAMMDLKNHQIFLYVRKNAIINVDLSDNFKLKFISPNKLWTQIGLASEMIKNKPAVLFIPAYAIPQIHPAKTIVTIHGLEYRYFPECYSLKERLLLEFNTKFSIKSASKIIVPSESTKKDLIKFYGTEENKIKVIHHGISSIKYQILNSKQNKKDFDILFIGRLEKRKNVTSLIKAFDIFKKNIQYSIPSTQDNIQLTLVGKAGFEFQEIKKVIQKSLYKDNIILRNYISESERNKLYQNADLFILPSFYEGFGLPVLEAMSYDIPVICSNNSSLPEIAGDAALLINPNDIEKIAEAMKKVFSDNSLRNKMIEKGFKNVERFSWEKCAKETMGVLLN